MIVRSLVIPLLALGGVALAAMTVRESNRPIVPAPGVADPPRAPFAGRIAASGIVEPSSESIAIAASVAGIVADVRVKENDRVQRGDVLFEVDAREASARLATREAALAVAERELARLDLQPRPEEVPPAAAVVAERRARLEDAERQLEILDAVKDPRAVSRELRVVREAAVRVAAASLREAEADLDLVRAGAWEADLEVARANVAVAAADVEEARTTLERLIVRAPIDATVLQLNVRAGEYAPAGTLATPLLILGATDVLHVRVDVDEYDAWRFDESRPAVASLRGNPALATELRFAAIEPFVVPKRSLSGDSAERVDTRVLQVLYAFDPATLRAYVGQQVDVFIEAKPRATGEDGR